MARHFGVLIPSTNTTVETECRLLPLAYQAHVGRLMSSTPGQTFSPSLDEDIEYQSRLLGTAKVELVILAQTSASLFADDYDEVVTRRMSAGAGVPAITSAQAIGRAVRALRFHRVALVSPYSVAVNERAARYFEDKHGLETVALEGFGATDSYAIGNLGPENARDAFARIDRPEIEVFVVPGGNFPTMTSMGDAAHVQHWRSHPHLRPIAGRSAGRLSYGRGAPTASNRRRRQERRRPRSR